MTAVADAYPEHVRIISAEADRPSVEDAKSYGDRAGVSPFNPYGSRQA